VEVGVLVLVAADGKRPYELPKSIRAMGPSRLFHRRPLTAEKKID
jgi:hypothetical protein